MEGLGVLFVIMDLVQVVVLLGVKFFGVQDGYQDIFLFYMELGVGQIYIVVSFWFFVFVGQWIYLVFSVEGGYVVFYVDCEEFQRMLFVWFLWGLELEFGVGFFVVQVGGVDFDKFQGMIVELKVCGDFQVGFMYCLDEEGDDLDGVFGDFGSGFKDIWEFFREEMGIVLKFRFFILFLVIVLFLVGGSSIEDFRSEEIEEQIMVILLGVQIFFGLDFVFMWDGSVWIFGGCVKEGGLKGQKGELGILGLFGWVGFLGFFCLFGFLGFLCLVSFLGFVGLVL